MTRLGAVFWLVLVVVAGFTTFRVKYAVQDIEDQLNRVRKQTIAEQQEIRVLTAEWTYLNQPERLADLNRRFLVLAPITAKQLQRSVANIPLRAPPVAPDVLLAAASDASTPLALDGEPPVTEADALPVAAVALRTAPAIPEQRSAEAPRTAPRLPTDRPVDPVSVHLAKAAPVQLARAVPGEPPNPLDALIAQIADAR